MVTALDGFQMANRPRRSGAGDRCDRIVLRRLRRDRSDRRAGRAADQARVAFGPADISADGARLIFAVVLAKGSVLKAIAMIVFGLLLSMVGSDIETGASRMAFNIPELADGLGFATVAMGLFGFAEIIRNLDAGGETDRKLVQEKVTGLMPTRKDLKDSTPAILRGTTLGSILGILPGGGAVIASFAPTRSKEDSKRLRIRPGGSRRRAPESANNAAAQTSFTRCSRGYPTHAVMALMVGAMTYSRHRCRSPGMQNSRSFVWGMIASMWVAI